MTSDNKTFRLYKLIPKEGKDNLTRWDDDSYKVFTSGSLETGDDLIRYIAYAYSWMPTMAKLKSRQKTFDWNEAAVNIKMFKNVFNVSQIEQNENGLKKALIELIPVVNNSIVGLSKVLHFAYPEYLPIIDSNVVKGWRKVFQSKQECKNDKVSFISSGALQADIDGQASCYLNFWKDMLCWLEAIRKTDSKITLRKLEVKLYLAGKSDLN